MKTTQLSRFYSFTINLRFVYCTVLENAWKTALTHLPNYSTGQVASKLEKPRLKASKFDLDHHFVDQIGYDYGLAYCYLSVTTSASTHFYDWCTKYLSYWSFKMQECLICFAALCVAQCAKRDTSKCAFPLPSSIQIKKKKKIQQAATNPLKKIHQYTTHP